ncbi:MAG: CU044_2847 family protein [Longimicrobiaceae bacterium]
MSSDSSSPYNKPILIELRSAPGLKQVAISPQDLARRSAEALENAMHAIQHMAGRVMESIDSLAKRPSSVEVEFGLKLDTAGHAIIASAGAECTLNIKLVWERKENDDGFAA